MEINIYNLNLERMSRPIDFWRNLLYLYAIKTENIIQKAC